MNKTFFCTLFALVTFYCGPLLSDTSLSDIEKYLNSFRSFEGRFEQLTSGGELLKGSLKLLKPGKLRLDYQHPSTQLIFSNDSILYVFDYATQDLTQIPLDQSLADVLLAEFIMINDETFTINNFEENPTTLRLSLSKKDNPDTGQLTLVFQKNPLKLVQWIIVDFQNQKTVVNLYDIKIDSLAHLETQPQQLLNKNNSKE